MRDLNVEQIKKLWILDLILRSGSLKKAALRAKVSPSAISQTLSALEKAAGKPLLIRSRGTILPTQDALEILEIVRPAFEAFERLRDLNHQPLPKISWLNFGTYESIAIDVLPGLLHALRAKMPAVKLSLRISRTANLLTMVRKGELCSALITEVDELDRFYAKKVGEDRLGLFVSRGHPIARQGWGAVAASGYATLSPGKDGLPRYFTKFIRRLDLPKPLLLSDSFEALRVTASSGALAAVLPHRVAARSGDLVEILPPGSSAKDQGRHGIYVVSTLSCDRDETDFLAAETTRLLAASL